ncbi:MAG: hypothetical protein DBX59_01715 [Bacillota bacterium]|nr:MAG: hypothetical protein DBX59_01715 [Bacillota bacterium]
MKSLILTAQEARELSSLGGLTVTKPIKPAPPYIEGAQFAEQLPGWVLVGPDARRLGAGDGVADLFAPPVTPGDAVYIREPWYRLRDPKGGGPSDRVILAADAVVGEEQTAYKWASPVSMPEAAARRFARVRRVSPLYAEGVASWEIVLELVQKDAAQAIDAGLVYSDAEDEEDASGRYTYTGNMSPEEYQHMSEQIDADRDRLEQVQKQIVEYVVRREYIKNTMAGLEGTGKKTMDLVEEDSLLAAELEKLADEEEELREALEDALGPVPGVDRYAQEALREAENRLSPDMSPEERVKLEAEIKALLAYLGIIGEPPAAPATGGEERPGAGEPSTDTTAAEAASTASETAGKDTSEEAEEIGSFTLGKCKYCGREWGVTLEGARGGGYPTQRTANAAATRLCDCAEAVANRAPIVGVALAVTRGVCRYCGQFAEVGPHPSQAAADETASEVCSCAAARMARREREQIEDAQERVRRLFGEGAEDLGFKAVHDDAVGLLERVVELIAKGPISSASINVRGRCKAKFSITSKGKIKVSRSETRSCDLEAGE